ncbi:protein TOO MANY MOUTHS-like [Diospyros lotus]|uniref:protein TOO MANY MOUTHS-like n=1 Tax=Diospyros lotus TaxID=55363 RepID=UPI00225AFB19|nr:protein TOO MANY MOUTHS-like [Diospyros lotus]
MDQVHHFPITILLLGCFASLPITTAFTVVMPDSGLVSPTVDDAAQPAVPGNSNAAWTDPGEQAAVYDVMKATGNSWATDIPDVCRGRWHGIECMPDKDNVYHVVSLSFGALSDDTAFPTCDPTRSFISPSVTKLPHIRTLFFYRCFTHNPQPIPPFLAQLRSTLQNLVLRENGHVGSIPDELGSLTRLKVLDLHKNNLNGSIPVSLSRLAGLRSLDLSVNKLTGPIPALAFPVLNVLDLNQNHLMGPIPPTLGNCQNLIKVDFSRNRLSGLVPQSISGLKDLILLDLSFNRLSGRLQISIESLNSLQALILKGNPVDSVIIGNDGFDSLKGLMILDLSEMNLEGPIPDSLGRLTSLRVLHLDGNRLNGSIPESFRDLVNLSELRLNNNLLTGRVPFGREMVWSMGRKLRLYNNTGLCFDANRGFDSSHDSGVGFCEGPKAGSARTVGHLTEYKDGERSSLDKSSAAICEVSVLIRRLLRLATTTLFLLCLW